MNSPKSHSASSPGPCVWGTVTAHNVLSNSKFTWATYARTVDSATCGPYSATSRCHTRRAV